MHLSQPSSKLVTAGYAAGAPPAGGRGGGRPEATSGVDYTAAAGVLSFGGGADGVRTHTIAVPVLDDRTDEPDEILAFTLRSVQNARYDPAHAILDARGVPQRAEAIATIRDDDRRGVTVAPTALRVTEGGRAGLRRDPDLAADRGPWPWPCACRRAPISRRSRRR